MLTVRQAEAGIFHVKRQFFRGKKPPEEDGKIIQLCGSSISGHHGTGSLDTQPRHCSLRSSDAYCDSGTEVLLEEQDGEQRCFTRGCKRSAGSQEKSRMEPSSRPAGDSAVQVHGAFQSPVLCAGILSGFSHALCSLLPARPANRHCSSRQCASGDERQSRQPG